MHRRNCSDRIGSQSRIALSAMSLSSREKGSRPLQPDGALKIHTQGLQSNEMAIKSANLGENQVFEQLAEPFRREIKLHCYRMLGSLHEADDLVQETYLRAWRSFSSFEAGSADERGAFRAWLYRIATNACLNALEGRKHQQRYLPDQLGPAGRRSWKGALRLTCPGSNHIRTQTSRPSPTLHRIPRRAIRRGSP